MNPMTTNTYPVSGMSCASCAAGMERTLSNIGGVSSAEVNFANSSVLIKYDPNLVKETEFKEALNKAGYDLFLSHNEVDASEKQEEKQKAELRKLKKYTLFGSLLSIPIMVIGMFFPEIPFANEIMWLLSTPVLFYFGRKFFVSAYKQAMQKKVNMDTLVAISTGVAYFFSVFNTLNPQFWIKQGLTPHVYFEASAVIICFILLGKYLEDKAKSSTSSSIKALMGLQAKTLTIVGVDGVERIADIGSVKMGDLIRVKPGEKIPVDGVVVSGSSFIDESMISGEPIAVQAKTGKEVFAGTINQKGSFIFKAQKVGGETVLAQIIKMVQQAQGSKASVQKLVDKVASVFVPIVLAISVITLISWLVLGGESAFSHGLLASITVLVIACPCALGLATPTAIMVGIGKGADNHILIKNAESLELGHKVNAVVLDKTGTITYGRPIVTEYVWNVKFEGKRQELESILISMELQSEHPLAHAIVEKLKESETQNAEIDSFESLTGKGISAKVDNQSFVVGSHAILSEFGIEISKEHLEQQDRLQSEGKTIVYFGGYGEVLASIAIADAIKPSSKAAIDSLKRKGIEVYMLTGDQPKTAHAIAKEVNIKNVEAALMPSQKSEYIKKLQDRGLVVAMVGDGINDSEALAQADVSIAMGKGSDIAMDVAQMTLITSDLNVIPQAFELSRQTVNTIRENLFWAFIYNLIGIPIAAGALYAYNGFLLNPMIAAAAMAFSSISVVLNSVRLKWKALD